MPIKVTIEQDRAQRGSEYNRSVPPSHRAKCTSCGMVDNVAIKGYGRRWRVCGGCGGRLELRRAPKAPKIVSYVVVKQINGGSYGDVRCVDRFMAEREAYGFVERGPVARSRVAQIVELLDDATTGSVRVLRYDNFRQRRREVKWSGGCEACKGRGLTQVIVKVATVDEKAVYRFVACSVCSGLGGELTRRVLFGRELTR